MKVEEIEECEFSAEHENEEQIMDHYMIHSIPHIPQSLQSPAVVNGRGQHSDDSLIVLSPLEVCSLKDR